MHDHSERQRRNRHRESWELLPWFVNDSLSETQRRRLQEHLAQCAECRREHEEQLLLRQQIQREESVLYTPHASLRKLMARIEQDEKISPIEPSQPRASRSVRQRTQWLTFAVAAEALCLIMLLGALIWQFQYERAAPRYSTLSTAPTIIRHGPAARVVFSPSLSLAELDQLLRSYNAQVIAGPSEAGVYTLMFPAAHGQNEVTAVIARLRADPQVRFAELAAADGAGN